MSIRIETVETRSFSMDYFRFGNGKDTLVILPGLSVQSVTGVAKAVAEAYRLLTDDFTIYVFDRRKNLPDSYSVSEMAQDTLEALQTLGLERICLFGASQGGMIAMELAIRKPNLVRKLILGSTAACVTDALYNTIEQWAEMADQSDVENLYLAFGKAIYPPDAFKQLQGLLGEMAKSATSEDLARFAILARGLKGFDVADSLEKIACPVLAIGSSDDKVLGADATLQIAEKLGGRADFELHMYDGFGHAAYDMAPDYKDRMLRFLTDTP